MVTSYALLRIDFQLAPKFCAALRLFALKSKRVILTHVSPLHEQLLATIGLHPGIAWDQDHLDVPSVQEATGASKGAPTYDELRPRDDDWWELLDLMVRGDAQEDEADSGRELDHFLSTPRTLVSKPAAMWPISLSRESMSRAWM